ncbi:DUF2868 domain-containing protein [Marinomonas pollencensis]|uniref:Uncharacterized protein DUF2868 n=1 Tax=Marinomonas pollencensis TaxID=491954 RepID=A0A3E0DLM1_9GAMM|nr:DUF2868 domain-containing protein [Marinomonas pollencensis]REG82413.1 uncharacterized protein DUF2868 [Marinomonas pollencensis]
MTSLPEKNLSFEASTSRLSLRARLSVAAWLESHTDFRLPHQAANLDSALQALNNTPKEQSYLVQVTQLARYFQRGLWLIFALTFVLGLLAVPPAFAVSASGTVNIFWLLIVLLGFHGVNLLIWFIALLALGRGATRSKGILLGSLILISNKIGKYSHINSLSSTAFWHWQCSKHSNPWLLSAISHTAWCCYLFAGFLMTLLLLLTNQVNFVWETTLLGEQQFLWLTQQLSVLPNLLGIAVPDQVDILASRIDIVSQAPNTRQHWANLLLASLILYGVLPRFLLGLFSVFMYRLKRLTLPKTTQELAIERRYQEQSRSQILDKEKLNKDAQDQHLNASGLHQQSCLSAIPNASLNNTWGLFEWSQPIPERLTGVQDRCVLNDASQQQDFLAASHPQPVYILVDGEHSPDRGSRRFLLSLCASFPDASLVITNGSFSNAWQRTGLESGIRPDQLFTLQDDKE